MPATEEQKVMPSEEVQIPVGEVVPPKEETFFVSKRKLDIGENKNNLMVIVGGVAFAAVVGVFMLSHRDVPGAKNAAPAGQVKKVVQPVQQKSDFVPSDKPSAAQASGNGDGVTAAQIEATKDKNGDPLAGARQSSAGSSLYRSAGNKQYGVRQNGKSLNSIPPFQPPTYQSNGSASAYAAPVNTSQSNEQARAFKDEVTTPSLVFAAQVTARPGAAGSAAAGATQAAEPVTNFGLEPGAHVTAHLESSVSTVGGVPAVAVVEYNYMRDGKVLIPAGSRVVGKIAAASSTGLVNMSFSEIYLPNGTSIPIHATGLDPYLHMVKGNVTGKNTGRQFALASLTSIGSMAAGFLGNNNNGAISQEELMRMQMAGNIGRAGDQAIQQMQVSQSIVVTVPSGTRLFVTFVNPLRSSPTESRVAGGQ